MKRKREILSILLAAYLLFIVVFAAVHTHDDGEHHPECQLCQIAVLSIVLTALFVLIKDYKNSFLVLNIENNLLEDHSPTLVSNRSPPIPFEK